MVQVLRLNTLSKLTFADRQRFDALVHDVFTGFILSCNTNPSLVLEGYAFH